MMNNKSFEKVVALKDGVSGKVCLVGIKQGNKYWHLGLSHCPLTKEDEIIHEFGYESDDDFDRIEREFANLDPPKPVSPQARLGWVSSEGDFYPCGYCCHRDLAHNLIVILYDPNDCYCGDKEFLKRKGWIAVDGGYILVDDSIHPSDKVLGVLTGIVEAFEALPEDKLLSAILDNREGYFAEQWFKSPLDRFLEGMRSSLNHLTGEDNHVLTLVEPISKRLDQHPGD